MWRISDMWRILDFLLYTQNLRGWGQTSYPLSHYASITTTPDIIIQQQIVNQCCRWCSFSKKKLLLVSKTELIVVTKLCLPDYKLTVRLDLKRAKEVQTKQHFIKWLDCGWFPKHNCVPKLCLPDYKLTA